MSNFELPPPVSFRGDAREMSQSRFLDGFDLEKAGIPLGASATVTIEDVLRRDGVKSNFHSGTETMWTLKLLGKSKELRCASATRKLLLQAFGNNIADWIGQKIALLRVQEVDRKTGEVLEKIVVQLPRMAPAAQQQATPAQATQPSHMSTDEIPF